MELGNFPVSLAVKNIEASKVFYENLGFAVFAGDQAQNWLIMKNGDRNIGLFQGMFENNFTDLMTRHFIFIYGSLRRGTAGSMSLRFPQSKFIAEAKVNGSLYDLGPYPGLLVNESNSSVTGEVYEVDDELLKQLDEFEASSNYVRKQVEISFGAQRKKGWTYEPDPECYRLDKLISSGDWIEYARMKKDE